MKRLLAQISEAPLMSSIIQRGEVLKIHMIANVKKTFFALTAVLLSLSLIVPQQFAQAPKPAEPRPDIARFQARVDTALSSSAAQRAYWGLIVADTDTGETLYSLNADHYFKPASNMKLF